VDVPFTLGAIRPVIVLPQQLLSEFDHELLKSAVGHELIHIKRRDYAFNLFYELLYLLVSFHPAASLIRRRIRQTRELSCDELVAERILNAEVYARSLVQLASSAPTLRRLSVTTTVGIADADILEARVMSLLKKSKLDTRRKRMVLIGLSLLLLAPCLAAASFAMKFDMQPVMATVQDPAQQEKERKEKETGELRIRVDGD
jgi:beta-lactamase regulating signal transducer with metallopeptidase domain